MASAKQIAANRANSKRSTGPNTDGGRLKSSRNAFRHGLSAPLQMDEAAVLKIGSMVRSLIKESDVGEQVAAATQLAETQLELLRIRAVRNELIKSLNAEPCSLDQLKRMLTLDRYERCALSKRREARQKLQTRAH
jgi:hypothetical protein